MINEVFTNFISNLGGSDTVYAIMGFVLAWVIVASLIDYIID